jgi:hypothetical protein
MAYRYRPSPGFLLVCLVYLGVFAFFAWGLRRPDLDRIWFLNHELKIGERVELGDGEIGLLLRAMDRHPGLCAALIRGDIDIISAHTEGFLETETSYMLRAGASKAGTLVLSCRGPREAWPVRVSLRGIRTGGERKLGDYVVEKPGDLSIALGEAVEPEIFELRTSPSGDREDEVMDPGPAASIRVSYEKKE